MPRRIKVVQVSAERWQQGPSKEWRAHRQLIAYGYELFAELALARLHERNVLDEIRKLPPMPFVVGLGGIAVMVVIGTHCNQVVALRAQQCVMRCFQIVMDWNDWNA